MPSSETVPKIIMDLVKIKLSMEKASFTSLVLEEGEKLEPGKVVTSVPKGGWVLRLSWLSCCACGLQSQSKL
ncbi:hypothetical protein Y1Q_0020366 [Alligator mississippiensis]|uniref:Uncharacterized protein n=1 Tax=Alligator mississippiensis TaxID=8496 RepID=A0A151N6I2_ALLMI|nr:hypothetical protein Y1Q_0020366 [Alligator mississippiensis]